MATLTSNEVFSEYLAGKYGTVGSAEAKAKCDEVLTATAPSNPTASGVHLMKSGKLRVSNGARVDMTLAQAVTVLSSKALIDAIIRANSTGELTEKVVESRREGGDPYTEYRLGAAMAGYNDGQVTAVRKYGKSLPKLTVK